MTYQLTATDSILRIEDNAFIPPDPANTDYAEYQQWLAAGNTPAPAPAPPAPPPEPTLHEKLASIGLTIDQLKEALK